MPNPCGAHSCKEGTVKPSRRRRMSDTPPFSFFPDKKNYSPSSLSNKLWDGIRAICFSNSSLDEFQHPVGLGFGPIRRVGSATMTCIITVKWCLHDFETQDSIFCQVL